MLFAKICAMLAARKLFESGKSVAEIADEAGRSQTTIRRWLRTTGLTCLNRKSKFNNQPDSQGG